MKTTDDVHAGAFSPPLASGGVTGTKKNPTDPSGSNGAAAATAAGAYSLGPETIAEKLRNALMIVNACGRASEPIVDQGGGEPHAVNATKYRDSDIAAVQRLVGAAIEQTERQDVEEKTLRKLVDTQHREIEALNLTVEAQRRRAEEVREEFDAVELQGAGFRL